MTLTKNANDCDRQYALNGQLPIWAVGISSMRYEKYEVDAVIELTAAAAWLG